MNKHILYIFFFFLVMANNQVNAQHYFKGQIIEHKNGSPISNVEIYIHETQDVELTDGQGQFTFKDLAIGNYYFTVFANGYTTLTDSIYIGGNVEQQIRLEVLNFELNTIDIIAQKEELFAIKQLNDIEGTSIYAGKKSEVIILDMIKGNLANNNSRQIYAHVAGLNIYEGSDGGLQLNIGGRGLDPNRTSNFNTRQNGYDISADVLGYPENYYTPPSESLSEIRIIRGASSLQYGTQFGGLIDFRTRKIPYYKSIQIISNQTYSSYNTFNTFNSIGWNKGKFSVNAFYNYKKGDGYRLNSQFKSNNLFFSIDYKLNSKTDFAVEFTYFKYLAKQAGGLTDQQFMATPRLSTRDRNWFDVDWKLYSFNVKHKFSKSSQISLNLFGLDASRKSVGYRGNPINLNENPITSLDEQDINGNYIHPRDLIVGNFKNYGAEFRTLNKFNIASKRAVLLIGSKYYRSNNTSIQGPGSLNSDADFGIYTNQFPDYANQSEFKFPNANLSFFAENIFYLSDRFSITPGLRFEYIKTTSNGMYNQVVFDIADNPIANNSLRDDRTLERKFTLMGVGINYKKNKELQIVANLSQNYRSVTFSDIRIVSPTFIVAPDIRDEKGFTADMGVKGRVDKFLSYDLTVYSVFYNDRIGVILDDRANRVRKNIGTAVITGTESLLILDFIRWMAPEKRNYTFNLFANSSFTYSQYLESEESNVVGKKVEFIPNVNFKSGLNLGYKNIKFSYQYTYLSKQYTDVQNSEIAPAGDKRSGVIGPIPSYSISDVTLSYQYKHLHFKAGINNLFDSSYFTRRATGYPGPGIIPSNGRSFFLTVSYKSD